MLSSSFSLSFLPFLFSLHFLLQLTTLAHADEETGTDARADAFGRPWLQKEALLPSLKEGGQVFDVLLLQSAPLRRSSAKYESDAEKKRSYDIEGGGNEGEETEVVVLFHSEVHYPYAFLGHHAVISPGAMMKSPRKENKRQDPQAQEALNDSVAQAEAAAPEVTECAAGAQALDLNLAGVRASLGLECVYGGPGTDVEAVRVPVLSSTQQVTRCPLPKAPPVNVGAAVNEAIRKEVERRLLWPQPTPWPASDAEMTVVGPSAARPRAPELFPSARTSAWAGVPVTVAFRGRIAARTAGVRVPRRAYPALEAMPATGRKPHGLCACASIWHRAEFLEEWLRYYTAVHGLARTFLYDNGSVEDDLAAVVQYLSAFFNMDYIWFPARRSQPAYMAHCLLRAAPVCEWVMFYDPDEYLTLTPVAAGGRLDAFLASQPARVGLVKVLMANYRSHKGALEKQPYGSVVKNFRCQEFPLNSLKGNIKSVVRPEAAHISLYNTVHRVCVKPVFEEYLIYPSHGTLHHLRGSGYEMVPLYLPSLESASCLTVSSLSPSAQKTMSWEVYRRRFERRAAPASFAKFESQFEASKQGMLPQFLEESQAPCEDYPRALAIARCRLAQHALGAGQFDCLGEETAQESEAVGVGDPRAKAPTLPLLLVPLPPTPKSRALVTASWLAEAVAVEAAVGLEHALPHRNMGQPRTRFERIVLVVQEPRSGAEVLGPWRAELLKQLKAAGLISADSINHGAFDMDDRRASLELWNFLFHWLESIADSIIFADDLAVPGGMLTACNSLDLPAAACARGFERLERALWQRWTSLPGSDADVCLWSWSALSSAAPVATREAQAAAQFLGALAMPEMGFWEREELCRG